MPSIKFFVRLKSVLPKLALLFGALALTGLVFEFVVFRFVLVASDLPRNAFSDGVVKMAPGQEGVYRKGREIEARFRINRNGWNSGRAEYAVERTPGKRRIAIIGDSYVEALQVDSDRSMAEVLERKLGAEEYEVFRFGLSGAPLSQYLHVFRREVVRYAPDVVVCVLVHNDFRESYDLRMGRYTRSFLRLSISAEGVAELPPEPYRRAWYGFLRGSASYRYLIDRQGLRLGVVKRLVLGGASRRSGAKAKPSGRGAVYEANVDVSRLSERMRNNALAADYVFGELRRTAEANGVELVVVMDGVRGSIYKGVSLEEASAKGAGRLNALARDMARKHGIAFLDLHDAFEKHFMREGKRFNFESDNHWNALGHDVAADALCRFLESRGGEDVRVD